MPYSFWILVCLAILSFGNNLAKHGDLKGYYDGGDIIGSLIMFALLIGIYRGW